MCKHTYTNININILILEYVIIYKYIIYKINNFHICIFAKLFFGGTYHLLNSNTIQKQFSLILNMYKKQIRENKNYIISITTRPIDKLYIIFKSIIGLTQTFGGTTSIFVAKYLNFLILIHNIK